MARKICEKCHREMQDLNFYTYKNGEKTQLCKSCLTMHVDNFDESTFLWILQKMDVPYAPWVWNRIRDKAYAKNPRLTGASIIGKYFSTMKLKQWKNYGWADTAKIQQEHAKQLAVTEEQANAAADMYFKQLQNGEISEAQYRTLVDTAFQKQHQYAVPEKNVVQQMPQGLDEFGQLNYDPIGEDNLYNEKNFIPEEQIPDPGLQLTTEEKQYLAVKWGRTYKAAEWVQLERKYKEMTESFNVQDADSKNSLIFICKTYLKMNQAIDAGDLEGYQKLSRVYDALRKSAKFTAAQKKDEKSDFIDSVGQLVAYCEKNGHQIPRYQITTPLDIVDKVIDDLKEYTRNLIYEDTALARQIEDYLKESKAMIAAKKDKEEAREKGLDRPQLSDEDILDFKDFVREQKNKDKEEDDE